MPFSSYSMTYMGHGFIANEHKINKGRVGDLQSQILYAVETCQAAVYTVCQKSNSTGTVIYEPNYEHVCALLTI